MTGHSRFVQNGLVDYINNGFWGLFVIIRFQLVRVFFFTCQVVGQDIGSSSGSLNAEMLSASANCSTIGIQIQGAANCFGQSFVVKIRGFGKSTFPLVVLFEKEADLTSSETLEFRLVATDSGAFMEIKNEMGVEILRLLVTDLGINNLLFDGGKKVTRNVEPTIVVLSKDNLNMGVKKVGEVEHVRSLARCKSSKDVREMIDRLCESQQAKELSLSDLQSDTDDDAKKMLELSSAISELVNSRKSVFDK